MLFYDIYRLNYFLAWLPLCGVSCVIIKRIYVIYVQSPVFTLCHCLCSLLHKKLENILMHILLSCLNIFVTLIIFNLLGALVMPLGHLGYVALILAYIDWLIIINSNNCHQPNSIWIVLSGGFVRLNILCKCNISAYCQWSYMSC